MAKKRLHGDPMGLAGTRLAFKRNKFWYRHKNGKWENVGTDIAEAKRISAIYNDSEGIYGTTAYWLDKFLMHCKERVKNNDLSQRTLSDYTKNIEELKVFFGKIPPESITPEMVQTYLDEGRKANRPIRANRERACLSSCISWLIRNGFTKMVINPCFEVSGTKRNKETKRDRYVTDEEYQAVLNCASGSVKLMMELTYRTLQRPESDIIKWTPSIIKNKSGSKVLVIHQNKTKNTLEIILDGELKELIENAIGDKPIFDRPIIHTRLGKGYTYSGLTAMLNRAIKKAKKQYPALENFGFRDLKGKGATDMWRGGVPMEKIQALCGHANKSTTEIYVKARWRNPISSNKIKI